MLARKIVEGDDYRAVISAEVLEKLKNESFDSDKCSEFYLNIVLTLLYIYLRLYQYANEFNLYKFRSDVLKWIIMLISYKE